MRIDYTLDAIDDVAKRILENVTSKIILFYGDMGVGKTTLIKSLLKCLGSPDEVSSPTFSIVNEYESTDSLVYHFDLYRIKDLEEAYNFGIEDYLSSNNWCIIEWPEKIEPILEKDNLDILKIARNEDDSRSIFLN